MPLQATSGAASYDGFGGGVPVEPNYIESVFSTYLYTGTDAAVTINNGIDLSTKGGMIWWKSRSNVSSNLVQDTTRGITKVLRTNTTDAETTETDYVTSLSTTGFSVGASLSVSPRTYATWTFRKQPKFFDVVTYTGNGTAGRTVAHNLGSVPGCMIVKRTDASNGWAVYHRSMNASPQDYMMRLNATDAAFTTSPSRWNNTLPTATEFTLSGNDEVNGSGATYVAYLFAHDAGGFGLTGTDNVVSCGSFTTDGSGNATVNLGYEPQWVLMKPSTTATSGNWIIADNMRGWTIDGAGGNANQQLYANSSSAESGGTPANLTSTGFNFTSSYGPWASQTWIYIAIRRGPMKVPTDATKVFAPTIGIASTPTFVGNFPVDFCIAGAKGGTDKWWQSDRLRGPQRLNSATTDAESSATYVSFDNMTGCFTDSFSNYLGYVFRRAPGFFDEVCYTGTGANTTFSHNLSAIPELMIVKRRNTSGSDWVVYHAFLGNTNRIFLNLNNISETTTSWNNTTPTSSVFSVGTSSFVNGSASTYVAYLFATCAGVSKVGSYTGTGTTKQIDCGFTAGARFVLIKRTDSTGSWYVWDSSRGIVSGNDPYLLLNSTAAEVTNTDYIDAYSAGFEISSTAPAEINASGGTYIFLSIA